MTTLPAKQRHLTVSRTGLMAAAVALTGAATAAWVQVKAQRADRENPPIGQFIDIDGVRLHYVSRGEGTPVVLLHGNTVMLEDFEASGLIDRLAKKHRVIAFDRVGFGHSTRPRDRLWTPSAQAAQYQRALSQLGMDKAVVIGHSIGAMVAVAMALDHPANVRSLVLIGGYYYPTMRFDALLTAPVALPIIGDVMHYTVTALSVRLMIERLARAMFAPKKIAPEFFSIGRREMMLRPVQIRANAEDAAFMMPAARSAARRYRELRLPITLIAGAEDKVVNSNAHSARLHRELTQSKLHIVPDTGHMVHYASQDLITASVESAANELPSGTHTSNTADGMLGQGSPLPQALPA